MSDVKFCTSCGTSLIASAVFCHRCGHKQSVPDPVTSAPVWRQDALSKTSAFQELNEAGAETATAHALAEDLGVPVEETLKAEPQTIPPTTTQPAAQYVTYAITSHEKASEPISQQESQPLPVQPLSSPNVNESLQQTNQQPAQPTFIPQSVSQQQAQTAIKKRNFPWFFTVLWLLALGAVGLWGYFIFGHETYPRPVFTEDVERITIFLGAAFALLYTLSLKLSMKKLRVIPTIILILAILVVVYLFGMIELIDGDWLHDTLSEITGKVIPAFGR